MNLGGVVGRGSKERFETVPYCCKLRQASLVLDTGKDEGCRCDG